MNAKDMQRAVNNIDDELILSAEQKKDNRAFEKKSKFKTIGKWAGSIAALLAVCVIGVNAFGGYAVKEADYYEYANSYDLKAEQAYSKDSGFRESSDVAEYSKSESLTTADVSSIAKQNVKLVYKANLEVQTTEYENTVNAIKALTDSMDGYIENSSQWNGNLYGSSVRNASYTVRVPSERFRAFIDSVGSSCHVVNINESEEDIGQQYFETEKRLETLKIKQERLQDLLKEAKDLSDIITLESELSNTEYEIDLYTTRINRYDSLVGYSTITISIQEVNKYDGSAYVKESFGTRILRNLKNGAINAWETVEDFILWFGYNLIGIVIFVVIVVIVWKKHLLSRLFRKIFRK